MWVPKPFGLSSQKRFLRAFLLSLLLHLALALSPIIFLWQSAGIDEETHDLKLYSVRLEKRRHSFTKLQRPGAATNAQGRGSHELDLDGIERVANANYEMLLAAQIERQRYYPPRARQLQQEGQPVVRLVLNRQGELVTLTLEKSCGNALLDETALDIVRRAQPFPPPPREYQAILEKQGRSHLVFRAPISFTLSARHF